MASEGKPRWVGGDKGKELIERPDSPEMDFGSDEIAITRRYEGRYATCKAKRPRNGTASKELGVWTFVKNSRLERLEGGRGLLTVFYAQRAGSDANTGDGGDPGQPTLGNIMNKEPIVEIEWARIDKALAQHTRYRTISDDDWGKIKAWQAAEQAHPDRYGKFQYQIDAAAGWPSLGGTALEYATKIRRGQDSYMVFAPVVRTTYYYPSKPGTGNCGTKGGQPGGSPGGYQYLKTADRAIRQEGQWTRVQEWTGADEWDEEIYGAQ